MSNVDKERSLIERILDHHVKDTPSNRNGGRLEVVQIAELGRGVACVYDSDGEFDLFFEVSKWEIVNEARGIYGRLMLEAAKEGIVQYKKLEDDYGMVCIIQDRWDPASYMGKSSFVKAHEAARCLLSPKEPQAQLYDKPKVLFSASQDLN